MKLSRFLNGFQATAICLLAVVLAGGLSACAEKDIPAQTPEGTQSVTTPEKENEPTTDQMKVSVTADLDAAVLSQFDDNSTGAAFIKRLPRTSGEITDQTRLVMFKGSDVVNLSSATIEAAVNVGLNGGYLVIEKPSRLDAVAFVAKYVVALLKKENERLGNRFLVNGAQARLKAEESAQVQRLKARLANMEKVANTRSEIIDRATAPIGELVIFGPNHYFMQEAFAEKSSIQAYAVDDEGSHSGGEQTYSFTRNGFHNGEMADAAAEWLNDVEQARREQPAASIRTLTRADASEAINELMDPSETFTFSGNVFFRDWENDLTRRSNRVKQTIRSWGVHDMDNNKDYYYVKQNVTLSMGERDGYKIFYPVDDNGERWWHPASNYGGKWNYWYGSFLSKYETSMELTGNGTITLEAAMPETKNAGTTTSISIGTSHSTTTTIGVTGTFSGGYTQNPGWNVGGSVGVSYSKGWTDSRSFNMGYSRNIEDLTVSKNANGNKVSWTYDANKPKGYVAHDIYGHDYSYCHQTVPEILVSDADLLNEICWSVAAPDGQYTINIHSVPETAALLMSDDSKKNNIKTKYEYTTSNENNDFSHTLLEPNRARQTWRMNIIIDEWKDGIVTGVQGEIEQYLAKSFPDIYANSFYICDKTPTSVQVISNFIDYSKQVFNNSYDILQGMADSYGIKRFTIHWRCDDMNITVKEGYTVDTEAPYVTKATESDDRNTSVTNLFDGNPATSWYVKAEDKQDRVWFVEFQYQSPVTPTAYTIWAPSDKYYSNRPANWRLMAKARANDEWTAIAEEKTDLKDDPKVTDPGMAFTFPLNLVQGKSWQYFRLEVSSSYGPKNLDIGDFNLEFGDTTTEPDPATLPAVSFRLDKDTDNAELLTHYAGKKANVTLGGRKFFKNGTWNSLTLPFDIDDFAGTPLEGASVRELKSVECSGAGMTLKFGAVASIKAHRPYIVRWDEGDDVQNPVFRDVIIKDGTPEKVVMTASGNEEVIAFVGVYAPLTLKAKDRNKLFFGDDSKLYWPAKDVPVYGNCAYFQLYNTTYTNVVIQ